MKTIQIAIDETLLSRVDQAARTLGVAHSVFIRRALHAALKDLDIAEMERKHREGYLKHPVKAGEFDGWENEQVWVDG